MSNRGFSLVELVVAMAIIGIILAISTMNFSSMQKKGQVETTTRTLYSTLSQARVDAAQHKQPRSVVMQASGLGYAFYSYSSENESRAAGRAGQNQASHYVITENSGPSDCITYFDVRGFTDNTGTFIVNPTGTPALVDCIIVGTGRTNMGKYSNGACTIQ